MKVLFSIIIILKIKFLTSSLIFPVGCPLNSVSSAKIQVKNNNLDCNCGNDDDISDEECLDKLDELHENIRLQNIETLNEILPNICLTILNAISPFSGETALLISSKQNGYISYVISMKLVEYGADVNKVGANGITPLINAIKGSNLPLVALLLINGANIGFSDNTDLSPLFHSVISRNIKMTHFLLQCGSNPNVADRRGITPLYYLLKDPMTSSTEEFLELLLDYGSSITDLTMDGKDAISFLINSGNHKLMNKLMDHSSFTKYITGSDIDDEYLFRNKDFSHNSTLSEINRKLANAKDKILRIITAIKLDFDRKVIFSLLLPELRTRNKDICIVKDNEGRTLLWWIAHFGDDELIKLIVNFYIIQSKSGILEFELCDLHEPDIYGNLPVGHLIYNFDFINNTNIPDSHYYYNYENPFDKITKYQLLQEMLLFQNPKTNTTLWYELIMGSNIGNFGEQKIVEYLSSPIINFNLLSFIVRCFCKPIIRNTISIPRSIPNIGTYEYDNVISILSLLLLLNKNFTSKVVLQSILRESMLQSFWCIQSLQHALITATILGKDDIIRSILMGRVQTLSEVLSTLNYSSEMSIKVASRLLGSIPPEFPNLDDLMLLPITFLIRYIILSNTKYQNKISHKDYSEFDDYSDEFDNFEVDNSDKNKILQYLVNNNHTNNIKNKTNHNEIYTKNKHMINQDLLLQYQFEPIEKLELENFDKEIDDIEYDEQMKIFKKNMRRGYFDDDDINLQSDISTDLDSLLNNFDRIFTFNTKINNYSNNENHDTIVNNKKEKMMTNQSINGALNLFKQLLSPELTKFVRSNSFEYIILLLQNSTCNYSRNNDIDLFFENENRHFNEHFNFYHDKNNHYYNHNNGINNNKRNSMHVDDSTNNDINNNQYNHIHDKIQKFIKKIDYYDQDVNENINQENIYSFYNDFEKKFSRNLNLGNCLIELPNICHLMMNEDILWVPMMSINDVEKDLSPTSTLILSSQINQQLYIPTLTYEYQKKHLGYLPEIPIDINVTSLGPIINRDQLFNLIQKYTNCDYSTSYTTFDELLAKKAIIITLLNSSPHHHIIPSTKKISFIIILTVILYLMFWTIISYFKVLYIKNMINEWSKKRIKRKIKLLKNKNNNKFHFLSNRTTKDKHSNIIKNSNKDIYNNLSSNTLLQNITIQISKIVKKVFLNILPQSVFKLRDYAEIFPPSGSKRIMDSILLSLSLIFTSPWYVYKTNNNRHNIEDDKFYNLDKITKSVLINAPINYFTNINTSVKKSNIQIILKYFFFSIQIISLLYLFTILSLISEYEYIWFLIGIITTTCFSATIRTYYTSDFVSNYCIKYFCGFSKDYYLYNYYYYRKNIKRRKNIRNIYSKLVNYAYNDINENNTEIVKVNIKKDSFQELENQDQIVTIDNKFDYYNNLTEVNNNINTLSDVNNEDNMNSNKQVNNVNLKDTLSLSNISSDNKISYVSEYSSSNITLFDSISSSSMLISPSYSSLTNESNQEVKNNLSLLLIPNNNLSLDSNELILDNHILNVNVNKDNGINNRNNDMHVDNGINNNNNINNKIITKNEKEITITSSLLSLSSSLLSSSSSSSSSFSSSPSSSSLFSSLKEDSLSSMISSKDSNTKSYDKYLSNKNINKNVDLNNNLNKNNNLNNSFLSNNIISNNNLNNLKKKNNNTNNANDSLSGIYNSNSTYNDLIEEIINEKKDHFLNINSISNVMNKNKNDDSSIFNKANLTINYKRFKKIKKLDYLNQKNNVSRNIHKLKIKKFKKIISSADDTLSCDNIRTNIGNVITDNKIHRPLYRLVDEASYNSPYEYFYIATICKIISGIIAISSNISIALFKSNSYLFRDSTLYFLYNKSPITVYLIEIIFIFWLSNFIFEIMKGLIILLLFVKQRRRLCLILVQHIPTQFKYSNVQEFIQIISYWRSAIQHILYKNTKLWTNFLNISVSINTLIFFFVGKIMLFIIYQKKKKIFNSHFFDFLPKNDINTFNTHINIDDNNHNHNQNNLQNNVDIQNNNINSLSEISLDLYKKKLFSNNHITDSISNIDDLFELEQINNINNNMDLISLTNIQEHSSNLQSKYKSYDFIDDFNKLNDLNFPQHSSLGSFRTDTNIYGSSIYSSNSINNILPNYKSSILSIINNNNVLNNDILNNNILNNNNTTFTNVTNFPNIYSNCEIIFLTLSIFMFIFFSYVIRLLYQINRSSVRTHSWLQNILHRTPPGAGIYIVIEKVLLVINSTPPVLKICGFDVTERFSGFTLYIFTPIFILIFVRFIIS